MLLSCIKFFVDIKTTFYLSYSASTPDEIKLFSISMLGVQFWHVYFHGSSVYFYSMQVG